MIEKEETDILVLCEYVTVTGIYVCVYIYTFSTLCFIYLFYMLSLYTGFKPPCPAASLIHCIYV